MISNEIEIGGIAACALVGGIAACCLVVGGIAARALVGGIAAYLFSVGGYAACDVVGGNMIPKQSFRRCPDKLELVVSQVSAASSDSVRFIRRCCVGCHAAHSHVYSSRFGSSKCCYFALARTPCRPIASAA